MFFKKKCTSCGVKNPKDAVVCASCGAPFASGKVESQLPKVKTRDELLRKTSALENLKGELASTPESRLALYESGLRALIEGGIGSFIIYECKERPECYVQFHVWPDIPNLEGEVSSQPVSGRGRTMLLSRGFQPPEKDNPNYYQHFESPQPRTLADLVEKAFRDVLDCRESYTAHVVEAVYEE